MSKPVVLITGALTGIGRATAVAFAREDARLIVSGRREGDGRPLVKELRDLGAEAEFVITDVRKEEDVRNLVDKTVARFGRLDVAVNNAGTEGQPGPLTEQTEETYTTTFDFILGWSTILRGSASSTSIALSVCRGAHDQPRQARNSLGDSRGCRWRCIRVWSSVLHPGVRRDAQSP